MYDTVTIDIQRVKVFNPGRLSDRVTLLHHFASPPKIDARSASDFHWNLCRSRRRRLRFTQCHRLPHFVLWCPRLSQSQVHCLGKYKDSGTRKAEYHHRNCSNRYFTARSNGCSSSCRSCRLGSVGLIWRRRHQTRSWRRTVPPLVGNITQRHTRKSRSLLRVLAKQCKNTSQLTGLFKDPLQYR